MNNIDISVTKLNSVIKRKANSAWHNENLFYKNDYIMVIALDGKAKYMIKSEEIHIKKNDVLIFPPGIPRAGYTDKKDPWEFITINFNLDLNPDAAAFFKKDYVLFENQGASVRSKFFDIAYLWEGKSSLYIIKCKSLIFDILYELIGSFFALTNVAHTEKLEAARTYIQANFRNKISIDNLAHRIGLSVSYFRKLFTSAYGQSPQHYIITLRINTAYDLLKSGEVNVSEAALLSGFDDIYYFSTHFKKHTGLSPSQVIHSSIRKDE